MDDHPDVSSAELIQRLNVLFKEFLSSTDSARALINMKQVQGETPAELAWRFMKLAKIAYQDAVRERVTPFKYN